MTNRFLLFLIKFLKYNWLFFHIHRFDVVILNEQFDEQKQKPTNSRILSHIRIDCKAIQPILHMAAAATAAT